MIASLSHPLPSLLSRTCRRLPPIILTAAARRPWPPSTLPAWWARKPLRARAAASTLQPARCTATVYCREAFQKQPWRSGHRGSSQTQPKQGRHTSWCATIVDRHWRPAHGIPSSLSLDSLPTTILHQPPIPPSPTYNMTLCSYKADRPHDPILKSVLHSPPDMHHPVNLCCRHHGIHVFLFPSPPTPPHTEPRAQHRRRARTGRPAAVREPLSVVPRPVSPDPKSSDGILCGCSIICSTVTIFAGASRRQSAARGEFPGGKHF